MSYGMQVWDAAGTLILDTSTKVLKSAVLIDFTANTTAVQSLPLPGDVSFVAVSAKPVSGGGDARVIESEQVGQELRYRARQVDNLDYQLNVVMF